MEQAFSKVAALQVLDSEALKIKQLIQNQQNYLCIAQCKAFEEVIDTQMYGFSRQVAFAVQVGIVSSAEGQQMLSDLEKELNVVYNEVFDDQKMKK